MTEDARDDADPKTPPRYAAVRKYALWAAQALVVLVLLDGFIDLTYPPLRAAAVAMLPQLKRAPVHVADRPEGWERYRHRDVPGLGTVVEPVSSPGLNVDAFGVRSTGNAPREGSHGVLLGSSQAFGYLVSDDATMAAAIERRRGDVTVATIAGPARTVAESMANWRRVAADINAPDFGILLFSNVELVAACSAAKQEPAHTAALIAIPARVLQRFKLLPGSVPCATPEARSAAVDRALYEVRSALAYGRSQTPNFVVVIAPLTLGGDAGGPKVRGGKNAAVVETLDLAVRAFRARLASENIPGVIDLSDAFDDRGGGYFIDGDNHFGRAGADKLAVETLRRLPKGFFDKAHAEAMPRTGGEQ